MDTQPDSREPEKRIRTLAGDIQTVKENGVPDLVPFVHETPPPAPTPAPASPPPKHPVQPSALPPTPPQAQTVPVSIPAAEKKSVSNAGYDIKLDVTAPKTYIRTFAGDMKTVQENRVPDLALFIHKAPPEPAQKPVALVPPLPPPPKPELPSQEEPGLVPLKTYAGDFSDRIEATHASMATILAAEQDVASQIPPAAQQSSHSTLLYSIGGAVLLIAGSTGAYIAYSRYATALAPVILAPTASTPIFVDDREEISGTSDVLLQAIVQSATRILAPHTVRLLHTPLSTTTDQSIFAKLNVSAPSVLVRNILAKGSMAGIVHTGEEQSPFFILSVASYGTTLAGMLSWEPSMPRSLEMLFPPYPAPIPEPVATSTATTNKNVVGTKTATTTVVIIPPITTFADGFRDEIVANHDVRIYRDAAGRSILLYGYWNQTTLVIARSPEAFAEILERLATSRVP